MYNYLLGLKEAFCKEPACPELQQEITVLHQTLSARLLAEEKKNLLRLVDAMEELQDCIAIEAFAAGLRLALGMVSELQTQEPYSFAVETERKACINTEEGREFYEQKQTRI